MEKTEEEIALDTEVEEWEPPEEDSLSDYFKIKIPKRMVQNQGTPLVGCFSVLDMRRTRGTALDWFRHTLYDYT